MLHRQKSPNNHRHRDKFSAALQICPCCGRYDTGSIDLSTLATQLLELVAQSPGMTDREIAERLRGEGAPQQPINQVARLLAGRGLLDRRIRTDGLIGNFLGNNGPSTTYRRDYRSEPVPALADFAHTSELIAAVSGYVLLPNPKVVSTFDGPVFRSIRDQKNRLRLSDLGDLKLLLDDNTTPRWAMLWAHGYGATSHPRGWTFAHIWARPKDPNCYTHLANLAMMPEYLASLSDKDGPLSLYLRYHSWSVYGWKPADSEAPVMPDDYESISWTYLREEAYPKGFILSRMEGLNNERCRLLRSIG